MAKNTLAMSVAILAASLAANNFCAAQTSREFSRQILVEGSDELSPELIQIVTETVIDRLMAESAAGQELRLIGYRILPESGRIGDGPRVGYLIISYPSADAKSDDKRVGELWEKTRKRIESALRAIQQTAWNQQQDDLNRKRMVLEIRKQENEKKLRDSVDFLQETELNSSGTPEQLVDATNQLWQVKLTRVGVTARREAIEKRIDELRAVAAASADNDPVLDELEKVVQLREQQMGIIAAASQAGAGVTSASDVSQARAAVSEARVALLKAKRSLAADSNGSLLASLNDELAKLYVDDAEMEAKGIALMEMIDKLQDQLKLSTRTGIDQVRDDLKRYRTVVEQTEQAMLDLETNEVSHREIQIRPLEDLLPKEEAEAAAK